MASRLIQHLIVRPSARQVDAFELALGSYLNLLAAIAITHWLIGMLDDTPLGEVTPWLRGIAIIVSLLITRPWHRNARFDRDTHSLTVDWRLLGLLPIFRREFDMTEKLLGVAVRTHTKVEEVESNPLGCAAVLLPFPLSLLVWVASPKETRTQTQTRSWPVLGVANTHGDRIEPFMDLVSISVADPFLDAVRELTPGVVAPDDAEWFLDKLS